MSEELIVRHCSPTLAGMKTGSLFNCSFKCRAELFRQVAEYNRILKSKGVYIMILRADRKKALIYVFRPSRLKSDFSCEAVMSFLSCAGYGKNSIGHCLNKLSERLCCGGPFPHEIGLFLGYPLPDVKAFIENEGQNCKSVGCWKSYSDGCDADKIFSKYKKCTKVYCKLHREGRSLLRLTVTA